MPRELTPLFDATAVKPDRVLLSIREAADLLTVSPPTVRQRIREGSLKATRIGPHCYRILFADLQTYVDDANKH